MEKYILKNGKFGTYFFDTDSHTDLPLETVVNLLNLYYKENQDFRKKENQTYEKAFERYESYWKKKFKDALDNFESIVLMFKTDVE